MLKIGFLPDVHRPYHDKRAYALAVKVFRALGLDILVLFGDYADFYSVSSHSKDPRRARMLDEEIADVRAGLEELTKLGAKRNIFIAGNHESRLERYLQNKAPELFGMLSLPEVLGLTKLGWEYIPYKQHTKLGKLHLTHDIGNAGRYSVFKCLDAYQHSIGTGHTHRMAYIVEGNATGEYKLSMQLGWLGDVTQIDYMHRAKANKDWMLGFGVGYLDEKTGITYAVPIPIINYTCVLNGKQYRG